MEFLIRLRLLLWLMVISLWGLMLYQFIREEERPEMQKIHWVSKQFPQPQAAPPAPGPDEERIPADKLFPQRPDDDVLTQPASPVRGGQAEARLARIPSSVKAPTSLFTPKVSPAPIPPALPARPAPEPAPEPAPTKPPVPPEQAPTPHGFVKIDTAHFTVFAEEKTASLEFLETLESLHANLMLDLAAFSPWARDERVTIYLFRSQESYRRVTGRPVWSGGASSVKRRKIYVYESEEIVGIIAHELTHIYFDSFFLTANGNPLWLSEGMATLVQTERGLAAPNWLHNNLNLLKRGGGYTLADLMRVEDTSNASDDEIRLWYSQAYSVVRFLIRSQYRSSFYKFCKDLRDGAKFDDALYRAYGMPFNRAKALEYAWRYDLRSGKL
ncbi:MAG: hypothetical protein WC728_12245 [Elusimicrobiota bacterium]